MPEYIISGIPVNFPFPPYDVQTRYMEKVIECLENSSNGILESPTGTGKTLSLLCASLAWLTKEKAQLQANMALGEGVPNDYDLCEGLSAKMFGGSSNKYGSKNTVQGRSKLWGTPKIIYASRTHTQIAQAIQELKRTSYNFVKSAVVGSREQLCIHPDVTREQSNSNKVHMCKAKVSSKSCSFYFRVEAQKSNPQFTNATIMDIEDLVKVGRKLKCCPYYTAKELINDADIIFMPYNYLLDPFTQKANKIELDNTIVILDEAHNVEKMCEESASITITSTDIAVCIEDITFVMKQIDSTNVSFDGEEGSRDFSMDDLVLLKEMLLALEKATDEIEIKSVGGLTYSGDYIMELLGKGGINDNNFAIIIRLTDDLIQFLTVKSDSDGGVSMNTSFLRRGNGLQKFQDLLTIVHAGRSDDSRDKIGKCFKVHIELEEQKQSKFTSKTSDSGWVQPKVLKTTTKTEKKINYWCFSPGFGMQRLLGKRVRSVILTSGTLAPLKPLISELDIPITVKLENPHIINSSQICVKIVQQGPDREMLNSNYENRSNPKYISSLGRTIISFCSVIPHGLLVFFPSYWIMNKCKDTWQASGIWSEMQRIKPIFIETTSKDAFQETMSEYYNKINEPQSKGAIFMAVCRGKVSEGLDFADIYGRAVIITGLPFAPYKDPKVILKKQYLTENRTRENELLSGDDWYFLEAVRAVNQAIGRVIRHKNDYGAILLCDHRFSNARQQNQLSTWIQTHLKQQQQHTTFGPLVGEVSRFFRNASKILELKPFDRNLDSTNHKNLSPKKISPINLDNMFNFSSKQSDKNNESSGNAQPKQQIIGKQTKIEDSNGVPEFDPSFYAKPIAYVSPIKKSSSILSRLSNEEVTTIDFNNTPNSYVTIHKRNLTERLTANRNFTNKNLSETISISDDDGDITSACSSSGNSSLNTSRNSIMLPAKKRKFKLISNFDGNNKFSGGNSNTKNLGETLLNVDKSLPIDRKEVLELIKASVSKVNYSLFIKSLTDYQRDSNIDELFRNLLLIFSSPEFHYLLKGMKRFVKDIHKQMFDDKLKLKFS